MNPDHQPQPRISAAFSRRTLFSAGLTVGLGALLAACSSPTTEYAAVAKGDPVHGGRLRVGLAGGGASDSLDAHIPVNTVDIARVVNLYEPLFYWDDDYALQPKLATSATPNADATVWTVELREGVRFHDGRPMTAEDVKASFDRITDPDDPKAGAAGLAEYDHIEVLDDLHVEFHLRTPLATFDDSLGQYMNGIVPADYDPAKPIGTGPFKAKEFTAGQRSLFVRNDDYWQGDEPYLDELEILNFNDDDALINALLSTQVDAIGQIPLALLEVIGADERIGIVNSETGMWLPFTMRVDVEPFDDERVRQAFRLAVDRPQMIEQVLSGNGTVGNDLYAPFDPGFNHDLPQRKQDVNAAKKLLADAGYPDGIDVELVTAPIQAGAVEAAQVFAQQAASAGIRVTIRKVDTTTFFGDDYLKWPFAQDFWYTRNFLSQTSSGSLPNSPFNETHWDDDEFQRLVATAKKTVDDDERNALIAKAQKIEYEKGGYIVWGFANQADAYQKYVAGLVENKTGIPLSGFEFRRVWMAVEK